jgi:molybdopterin/thiamine biosynthesis adenylyltransferase
VSLASARALVVGAGGLGCPAALALARAGNGTIGIADDDEVELSNLHRQILFDESDVGRSKVERAAASLRALAPGVEVEALGTRLLPKNAVDLASRFDVVIEGSDNFPTKFLAADAARIAKRPIVHAAALRWHGTVLAVSPNEAPCYRCLFEDVPAGDAPNCATAGVVGPMVGVVAAIQADLALAILEGRGVFGTLVTFDGKSLAVRRRTIPSRRDCPLCGDARSMRQSRITGIEASRYTPPGAAGPPPL